MFKSFSSSHVRNITFFLTGLLCVSVLSGCGAGSARSGNDPSQDVSRLENGPTPEDLKAMQDAAKKNSSGAPPQAAKETAPAKP